MKMPSRSSDRVIVLDPENAIAHFVMGTALSRLSRYQDAVIALDRALEYDGGNARIHACKGYALYRLNRFKEAAESFTKAQKRQPKDTFTLLYRGKSLLHNEQWEMGIAAFDKLLALDGKNAAAWYV